MLITGRMENYFPNQPDSFIPDRWNRDGEYPKNPYAFLPFGFGPRMCLGKCFNYSWSPAVVADVYSFSFIVSNNNMIMIILFLHILLAKIVIIIIDLAQKLMIF